MINDNTKLTDQISMGTGKGLETVLKINCNCKLELFDQHGNLKDKREIHNTVTTAGKQGVADQVLAAPSLVKMGWMAVGTGSPAATLLGAEVARVAFTSKTRGANAIITVVGTFAAGTGTGALTEAGTFDVVTANTINAWMFASYSVINKGALDSLVCTWTLTIS